MQHLNNGANTFGNGDMTLAQDGATFGSNIVTGDLSRQSSSTQYSNNTPGPPFHLSNINSINMYAQNAQYMPTQVSGQASFGPAVSQDFISSGFAFQDGNEMDLSGDRNTDQPSPATISSQSRGGSTSQSSYSPTSGIQNEHNLPYRASPKPNFTQINNSLPRQTQTQNTSTATSFQGFSPTSSNRELFSASFSATGNVGDEVFDHGFLVGNEWEYNAMNTGTGMTPMSDGNWNQMLENVTMGWDTVIVRPQEEGQG